MGASNYSASFSTGELGYYVACPTDKPVPEGMEGFTVPASVWAIFPCKDKSAEAVHTMEQRIITKWLPSSGYEFGNAPDVEVYSENGLEEVWIPVLKG